MMKVKILKRINWMLGALVAMLGMGLHSCKESHLMKYGSPEPEYFSIDDEGTIELMYGVPSDLDLTQDGENIEGDNQGEPIEAE